MTNVDKVKSRRSYREFKEWWDFLNTNPDKIALMKMFYSIKDNASGYGSQRNATAAYESMNLVLNEAGVV